MGYFSGWTWQKWLGKLAPIIVVIIGQSVWEFVEAPAPVWVPVVAGAITFLVQQVLALFPPKPSP